MGSVLEDEQWVMADGSTLTEDKLTTEIALRCMRSDSEQQQTLRESEASKEAMRWHHLAELLVSNGLGRGVGHVQTSIAVAMMHLLASGRYEHASLASLERRRATLTDQGDVLFVTCSFTQIAV